MTCPASRSRLWQATFSKFTSCCWWRRLFPNQQGSSAVSLQDRSNCCCHCPIYLHFHFCIDGYHTPQRASPAVKWHWTGNLIIIQAHVSILFNPFVTLHCFLITSSSDRSAMCTRSAWEPAGNGLRDKVSPGRSGQRCFLASVRLLLALCQAWKLSNVFSMHTKTSCPLSAGGLCSLGLRCSTARPTLLHKTPVHSASPEMVCPDSFSSSWDELQTLLAIQSICTTDMNTTWRCWEGKGWEAVFINFFPHTARLFQPEHLPYFEDELNCGSTDTCSARGLGDLPLSAQTANPRRKKPLELLPLLSTQAKHNPGTGSFHKDVEQKAGSTPSENGGLLFLPPGKGGWGILPGFPMLAEPCTQAGQRVLSCLNPCCSRQLPALPAPGPLLAGTEAQRVSQPGDSQALPPGHAVAAAEPRSAQCEPAPARESLTTAF